MRPFLIIPAVFGILMFINGVETNNIPRAICGTVLYISCFMLMTETTKTKKYGTKSRPKKLH